MQATPGTPITPPDSVAESTPSDDGVADVRSSRRIGLITSLGLVGYGLDQGTKYLAENYLDPENPVSLLGGFLTLRLIYNSGAAFSFGSNVTIVFTFISLLALTVVLVYPFRHRVNRMQAVILGFLLAGILGNLTDRLFRAPAPLRGHVVDFISLPYFAIFNVADIFITTAAALIILVALRHKEVSVTDNEL